MGSGKAGECHIKSPLSKQAQVCPSLQSGDRHDARLGLAVQVQCPVFLVQVERLQVRCHIDIRIVRE